MPKILLVANTDWYLYNFKLSLALAFQQAGFEVVLASPGGEYVPRLVEQGFRHISWKVGRQSMAPWMEIGSILGLAKIYRQEKPAVLMHYTIKPVLYGALAARLTGIKRMVHSITGRGYVFMARDIKASLARPLVRWLYRLSFSGSGARVIFENEGDRQYFLDGRFITRDKTALIEGVGVDTDLFTPSPEPDGAVVVSYIGRLLWDKGVGVLVEAARMVRNRYPVKVTLVGQPDPGNPSSIDPAILQAWVDEGVVELHGWRGDIKEVFDQCHLVALPSFGEGVPTVLLEAAASGRAIIASDIPGCRVVVEDGVNGLLVPPGSVEALADAIVRLIDDPQLRQTMGAAGREKAVWFFTKQRINQATIDLVNSLLTE